MNNTTNAEEYLRQGNELLSRCQYQAALDCYERAAAINPENAEAYWKRGNVLLITGKNAAAADSYRHATGIRPDHAGTHHNLGIALQNLGDHQAALISIRQAVSINPSNAGAHNSLGIAYKNLGFADEAMQCYRQALDINPDHAEACNNYGNALCNRDRRQDALPYYRRAILLKPEFAEAHYNLGQTLAGLGSYAEAGQSLAEATSLRPQHAPSQHALGKALLQQGLAREALKHFQLAVLLKADDAEIHFSLGLAYKHLNRYDMAAASFAQATVLRPAYAEAHNNRGLSLFRLGGEESAEACFRQAIALNPRQAGFHYNLGNTLQHRKQHRQALACFDAALQLQPDYPFLYGQRLFSKMQICDWHNIAAEHAKLLKKLANGETASGPYPLLAIQDNPSLQQTTARIWLERQPVQPLLPPLTPPPRHDKIRIGYFSADFHTHPVATACGKMLATHDRERFETIAFSYTPTALADHTTRRLASCADRFVNAAGLTDADMAQLARNMEIDIAVDLGGHTGDNRTGIFAQRAAPVQVNFLGYPGTTAADYMDYIIADHTVIPAHHRQYYSEKPAYMPHCFLANDDTRPISAEPQSRRSAGLPERGFVYCSFNNSFKITPAMFRVWMAILKAVQHGVLWLSDPGPEAAHRLQSEAERRGVDGQRLIFAGRVNGNDAHLGRLSLADLFLDSFPYNAHATASDALWAGLPLLTLQGRGFASRVAASQLQAIGLPELITGNTGEYQNLAVELANKPHAMPEIRRKLQRNRSRKPLFNTLLYTRHLEAAYSRMYQRSRDGLPPVSFDAGKP